jgi:hypothetical protein
MTGEYKLGINWCMTKEDGTNDGKKNKVENKPVLREYDPVLYDILKNNDFTKLQNAYFNKGTKYYGKENIEIHLEYQYEKNAFQELKNQDVIFFDPDNGLEMPSKPLGQRYKYIPYRIAARYWNEDKSIIIFQHKDRKTEPINIKVKKICECILCNKKDIIIVNSKKVHYICIINKRHKNLTKNITDFCRVHNKLGYNIEKI